MENGAWNDLGFGHPLWGAPVFGTGASLCRADLFPKGSLCFRASFSLPSFGFDDPERGTALFGPPSANSVVARRPLDGSICLFAPVFFGFGSVFLFARLFSALPTKFPFVIRLASVLLALLTVALGHLHAARLQRASYSVSLTESPTEQMRVVLLSDLHLGAVASEGRLERIVSAVNEESPDVICIAGDLFDNDYSSIQNPERAVALLKSLQAKYGVYACLGNHDAGSEINKMLSFLEQAEIRLLSEEFTVINGQWILAGRLDASPIGKGVEKERQALSQLFSGVDPSLPLVVMDHNPAHLSEYAGEGTLVLSGHTHKGQLFPGRLITRAMFEVDYGFGKTKSGAWAIVTSGAGTWGPPVRVGTDCEIVSIDLKY